VQQGLTQDDFDMYYEVWERFDEKATQYIDLEQLCEFVDTLEEPLRIPAPNQYKLVTLNIPICADDRVHCVDILDALTKNFLGTADDEGGDLADIAPGPERKDYQPIGSTLQRQRLIYCARIIQKAWRKHRHSGEEQSDSHPPDHPPNVPADTSAASDSVVVDVGVDDITDHD